jgi:hypothetical protein
MNKLSSKDYIGERLLAKAIVQSFSRSVGNEKVLAIVLTLKQFRKRRDNTWEKLSRDEVCKLAKKIGKRLNMDILKTAYRRHGQRLKMLWTLEGDGNGKHLHLNLALAVPENRILEDVKKAFELSKMGLSWTEGRRYSMIEAFDKEGWASYINKEHGAVLLDESHFSFD